MNLVPNKFVLTFDFRVTPKTNLDEFEAMLQHWAKEVGAVKQILANWGPASILIEEVSL